MPKWYKPQLNEVGSVWLEPSAKMGRQLSANKKNVLGKLRFYCAHGRRGVATIVGSGIGAKIYPARVGSAHGRV